MVETQVIQPSPGRVVLTLPLLLASLWVDVTAPADARVQEPTATTSLRGKRLVLKDGTVQIVRSWEQKGDRIRFYSLERSAWEEIPADLVDFPATEKAAAETAQRLVEAEEKLKDVRQTELAAEIDVDASIEIAPGVFLPDEDGLFTLACCTVLALAQISAESRVDKKQLLKQIFTPIPIVPGRQRISTAGKAAVVRITNNSPEFYIRTGDNREPEMELIRATVKGDKREINVVSTNVAGEQRQEYKAISTQRWQVAKGVYRITLAQSLEPGEYVLAEFLTGNLNQESAGGFTLYVWDFGVDRLPGNAAPPVQKP
jgi:hypothetical protein